MSKRKTYDEEFKKTLVNLILNGQSLKEVSREYGVSSSNLILWRKNIVISILKVTWLSLLMISKSFKKN